MKGSKKIWIDSATRISELMKGFNIAFPFLRIEIYRKGEAVSLGQRDFVVFEIANVEYPEGFVIEGDMKVSEIENLFQKNLGLEISIFRKMGTSEVETTFTSLWTLNHQNNKGEEIQFAI